MAEERMNGFSWGRGNGDCLLFLLGWWELATGRWAPVQWRGSYSDEAGARHALHCFGGAIAAVCDIAGPPRIGSQPQRGDIGLRATDGWHIGMICTGTMWAFRDAKGGVRMVRLAPDLTWAVPLS